jgi:hypothetical protein
MKSGIIILENRYKYIIVSEYIVLYKYIFIFTSFLNILRLQGTDTYSPNFSCRHKKCKLDLVPVKYIVAKEYIRLEEKYYGREESSGYRSYLTFRIFKRYTVKYVSFRLLSFSLILKKNVPPLPYLTISPEITSSKDV